MIFIIIILIGIFLWWSLVPSKNQRAGINSQTYYKKPSKKEQPLFKTPTIFNFTKFIDFEGDNVSDVKQRKTTIIFRESEASINYLNKSEKIKIIRIITNYYGILLVCENCRIMLKKNDEIEITKDLIKYDSYGDEYKEMCGTTFIK